jgi:vacuolar iron transporter family protein
MAQRNVRGGTSVTCTDMLRTRPASQTPWMEHHHRNVSGGAARAAVFGVSDGLQTNIALILGVAGASSGGGFVRLAGLAGLIGGAFSMAAGEYVSMTAQIELFDRELTIEREAIANKPERERRELAAIYRSKGVDADTAERMSAQLMADPDIALETHAKEELGVDPSALGSPWRAAVSSFVSFAVGAFIPLIPWLGGRGPGAVWASLILAVIAAAGIGAALSRFTGRPWLFSAVRQVAIACFAAGVTFGIGHLVGVGAG